MASESILIVDDNPVNLKLTRILLINQGYKVLTAGNAEEALTILGSFPADLVLTDIDLSGVDGLELSRRIRKNPKTAATVVLAVTDQASRDIAQTAIDAGFDGFLIRPVDGAAMGERIRELLSGRRAEPVSKSDVKAATTADLQALRIRFLEEGREKGRVLLLDIEGRFQPDEAARVVHQWIGTGGLLGYSAISRLAREVETVLMERPLDNAQLRESMGNLVLAFSSPREAKEDPIPDSIRQTLASKRIALIGFPSLEEERVRAALQRVEATVSVFRAQQPPDSDEALLCELNIVHLNPETEASAWLDPASSMAVRRPMVLAGTRDDVIALDPRVQAMAREYLMGVWQPEEALVRFSLALAHRAVDGQASPPSSPLTRTQVVIADDDPAVLALVRTALENFGMTCIPAGDGVSAIALIRQHRPHAAVLDVNMPRMDGYEVLAAIRAEEIPARVLLLTARQQEGDVLRGFTLGADDYVVKPFSPMELVARLKRLLTR